MPNEAVAPHSIIIENRKTAVLTGIKEVINYSSESIDLVSSMGNLTIRGTNLKIEAFSTQNGDIHIIGTVVAVIYVTDTKKQSFFSGLFK